MISKNISVRNIHFYVKPINFQLPHYEILRLSSHCYSGDSGGPMVTEINDTFYQIAVIHGSLTECSNKMPAIFVRLDHPKILSYIKNELDQAITSSETDKLDLALTSSEKEAVIQNQRKEDRDKDQGNLKFCKVHSYSKCSIII